MPQPARAPVLRMEEEEEKHIETTPAGAKTLDAWLADALRLERLAIGALLERRHGSILWELRRRSDQANDLGIVFDENVSISAAGGHTYNRVAPMEVAPVIPMTRHDVDSVQVCDKVAPGKLALEIPTKHYDEDARHMPGLQPIEESECQGRPRRVSRLPTDIAQIIDAMRNDDEESVAKRAQPVEHRLVQIIEAAIAFVIVINTLIMAAERQYASFDLGHHVLKLPKTRPAEDTWPGAENIFLSCEWVVGCIFTAEVLVMFGVLRARYFRSPWHLFDFVVVFFWVITRLSGNMIVNPTLLRMARLMRLARLLRVVRVITFFDPLHILLQSVTSSIAVLFWSLLFLVMVILMVSLCSSELLASWMEDDSNPLTERTKIFDNWGSFSRASTTVFEITLGNWGPPCRLLQNTVNEWWAVWVVCYKCVFGFAVLQVITSVFIQQTFKVVAHDEEVMIKERAAASEGVVKNLDRLFVVLDVSGDGYITRDEFEECISDRKVQSWLGALDINVTDAGYLFQVLDLDGDGRISRREFIDGIRHVKGTARSLDMMHLLKSQRRIEKNLDEQRRGVLRSSRRRIEEKLFEQHTEGERASSVSGDTPPFENAES